MTQDQPNKPALNVFTRVPAPDGSSKLGSQIGVGFEHKEGGGYNIILDAVPIPEKGRISLVAFKSEAQ
jgi:hypothetical protein